MDFSLINLTLKKDKKLDDVLIDYGITLQAFNYFYTSKTVDGITYYTLKNDSRISGHFEDVNSDKRIIVPLFDLIEELKNKENNYGLNSIRDWSADGLLEIKKKLIDAEADEGKFYLDNVDQYDQIITAIKSSYSKYFNLGVEKEGPLKERYRNSDKFQIGYVPLARRGLGGKGSGKKKASGTAGASTKKTGSTAILSIDDSQNKTLKARAKKALGQDINIDTDLNLIIAKVLEESKKVSGDEEKDDFYSKVNDKYLKNIDTINEKLDVLLLLVKLKFNKNVDIKKNEDLQKENKNLKNTRSLGQEVSVLKVKLKDKLPVDLNPNRDFQRNEELFLKYKNAFEKELDELRDIKKDFQDKADVNPRNPDNELIRSIDQQIFEIEDFLRRNKQTLESQEDTPLDSTIKNPSQVRTSKGVEQPESKVNVEPIQQPPPVSGGKTVGASTASGSTVPAPDTATAESGILNELKEYLKRYQQIPFSIKTGEANDLEDELKEAIATDPQGKLINPQKVNNEELRKHRDYFAKNIGIAGKTKDQIKTNQEKEQAKDMIDQAVRDAKAQDIREKEETKDIKLKELRPDINEGKDLYEGIDKVEKKLNNQTQFLKKQVEIKDEEIKLLRQKLDDKKNKDFNDQLSGIAPVFRNFLNIQIGDIFAEDYTDYVDTIF